MALSQTTVLKLYNTVMEDVIANVRETFLDDGVDEQVLQELRSLWESKLLASKAVEQNPEPPEHQPPPIVANNLKANGNKSGIKKVPMNSMDQHNMANTHHSGMKQLGNHSANNSTSNASNQQGIPSHQPPNIVGLDPNNRVPVQLSLPAQAGVPGSQPRVFTLEIPSSALQNNQLHQVLTGPIITATMNLPQPLAATLLQQHINAALSGQQSSFNTVTANNASINKSQLDGACDSSDEEMSEGGGAGASEDDGEAGSPASEAEAEADDDAPEGGAEEEPLNSGDDVSEEDPSDMFDTDNVVVCQYDKITRSRNKWKFYLKDGIMNLSGKDFVFQKANGDAEW